MFFCRETLNFIVAKIQRVGYKFLKSVRYNGVSSRLRLLHPAALNWFLYNVGLRNLWWNRIPITEDDTRTAGGVIKGLAIGSQ
jgi:hypothetical protein